ncbi:hypothetical protein CERSUDRAFT_92226 [Gelatoporia subvermispora B]|uniref:Uncharacterized protein n=1 Tax=Ceriporiopsis subvermispora (strain B) TaxID=914234 RepID=M2QRL5_CERS8|nr:hypothetical protein CERSUDRAFT_92226 [Gelatoporia subvermispora B]
MFWQPHAHSDRHTPEPEQVYTKIYNSDAMLEADYKLQAQPCNPEDPVDLEYAIAPLLFWSDSTHLANFSTASLWPIYLFFGAHELHNTSPTFHLCPTLIQDVYFKLYGIAATATILAFCKRELFHAVWLLLLNAAFLEAYVHSIIIDCGDGIKRRIFPRILTYSADYPERILVACIRFLAQGPCAVCLMEKAKIAAMGTKANMKFRISHACNDTERLRNKISTAREWISKLGYSLTSQRLARLLDSKSLLPIESAFSRVLSPTGFNHYQMLVPDLMHEFELGVWKAVFTHLIRVLYAAGGDRVQELNKRFCQVPSFGISTIMRFSNNVSGMKKLATRDFENILQCCISVFEGLLLDGDNNIVLDLLFALVTWHAYAKLHMHTKKTLATMETATTTLGAMLCRFERTTCQNYDTYELPKEEAACGQWQAAQRQKGKGDGGKGQIPSARKHKQFNLQTSKLHALGHYMATIRQFGTTDNYTSQVGEVEHCSVKKFYTVTNKKKYARQIARHRCWHNLLLAASRRAEAALVAVHLDEVSELEEAFDWLGLCDDDLPKKPGMSPWICYPMFWKCKAVDMLQWVTRQKNDPALKDLVMKLTDHVLACVEGQDYDGDEDCYSDREQMHI